MNKVKIETQDREPTPSVMLRSKEGSKVVGRLHKKIESSTFPGNYSYLISVEETDAPIQLFDKDTESMQDVDIAVGDLAWIKGCVVINKALAQVEEGTRVEIVYTGKGEAKKGRSAPFLFDVFKLED